MTNFDPPQILAACREEPSQLRSTIAMLHAAYKQVNTVSSCMRVESPADSCPTLPVVASKPTLLTAV